MTFANASTQKQDAYSNISEDHFVWVDESPLEYINWAKGHPGNPESGQDCVNMHTGDYDDGGEWQTRSCESTLINYVCRKEKG